MERLTKTCAPVAFAGDNHLSMLISYIGIRFWKSPTVNVWSRLRLIQLMTCSVGCYWYHPD